MRCFFFRSRLSHLSTRTVTSVCAVFFSYLLYKYLMPVLCAVHRYSSCKFNSVTLFAALSHYTHGELSSTKPMSMVDTNTVFSHILEKLKKCLICFKAEIKYIYLRYPPNINVYILYFLPHKNTISPWVYISEF